jgi:hypothetical protein
MEISEEEFKLDLAERRAMQHFIKNFSGDASEIQSAWLKFRAGINVYAYLDTAESVRVVHDKAPVASIDELLSRAKNLLEIHSRLNDYKIPVRLGVQNKFKYRGKVDSSQIPSNWIEDDGIVLDYDKACEELEKEAVARGEQEAKDFVDSLKSKNHVKRTPKPEVKPSDKKFTVI